MSEIARNRLTHFTHFPPHDSDLSNDSAEILFEVYDRAPAGSDLPPKFLGLGLVGIDELPVGPSTSQILALQPRPYESDDIQGAITVEFVFIEGAEVPSGRRPHTMKEAFKLNNTSSLNGRRTNVIRNRGSKGISLIFDSIGVANGADLADTAIRALEGGALAYNGNPSKSTLIIHSVQRVSIAKFCVATFGFRFSIRVSLRSNENRLKRKIEIVSLFH